MISVPLERGMTRYINILKGQIFRRSPEYRGLSIFDLRNHPRSSEKVELRIDGELEVEDGKRVSMRPEVDHV